MFCKLKMIQVVLRWAGVREAHRDAHWAHNCCSPLWRASSRTAYRLTASATARSTGTAPPATHSDNSPQNASTYFQTPHGTRLGRCHTTPARELLLKLKSCWRPPWKNKLFSDILKIEWREDKVQVQLPSALVGGWWGVKRDQSKQVTEVKVRQSYPTLCDPVDCIVHGIL